MHVHSEYRLCPNTYLLHSTVSYIIFDAELKIRTSRVLPLECHTRISTQMKISLAKNCNDVTNKNNLAHVSNPFPNSKDIRYQLRFYSYNLAVSACALYIDVAHDYIYSLKSESSFASKIRIPQMDVTVTVSLSSTLENTIVDKVFEKVSARSIELGSLYHCEFVTVTSFPNLVRLDKLDQYRHSQQRAEVIIRVDLECFSQISTST